jgi:hypothetical protein
MTEREFRQRLMWGGPPPDIDRQPSPPFLSEDPLPVSWNWTSLGAVTPVKNQVI